MNIGRWLSGIEIRAINDSDSIVVVVVGSIASNNNDPAASAGTGEDNMLIIEPGRLVSLKVEFEVADDDDVDDRKTTVSSIMRVVLVKAGDRLSLLCGIEKSDVSCTTAVSLRTQDDEGNDPMKGGITGWFKSPSPTPPEKVNDPSSPPPISRRSSSPSTWAAVGWP